MARRSRARPGSPRSITASVGRGSSTTRKVANSVTVTEKIISFEETFNKLRSLSSLDIVNSFSASAQGEIAGIGGTVSNSQTISAHTELEIEKMNHVKKERIIDDRTVLDYPGPILYEADEPDGDGGMHRQGSIKYPGEIWLVERPVLTLQTTTPITQYGIWDCGRLHLNVYDWAGNYRRAALRQAQERAGAERAQRTARSDEGQSRPAI